MKSLVILFYICLVSAKVKVNIDESVAHNVSQKTYKPDWRDLDQRPLPRWYDEAKIGIFLHWGVYAVPGFGSEWFWFRLKWSYVNYVNFMKNYRPGFTYQDFAPMFRAELFDPEEWASLFAKSGAKYVVLTSKHHDGFTLFPSKRSFSWNAVDVGPKQDLVRAVADAVRAKDLKFGVYHSLYEWFNPIYLDDKANLFATQTYRDFKLWPDIKQLVNDYKPSIIWADGDWEADDTYWNSTSLLAWLYNDSPVRDEIVVNDRWGIGIPCHHGDFYNCADKYNPGTLQSHKWENAFTMDSQSWGYRRNINMRDVLDFNVILHEIVSTISCGGNAIINIGPTKEGTIIPIFQERLLQMGEWLAINGEAIYKSSPWKYQNDSLNHDVWYTCSKVQYNARSPTARPRLSDQVTAVYAIFLQWPAKDELMIKDITSFTSSGQRQVQLLGNNGTLFWKIVNDEMKIYLPSRAKVVSKHAWTLKFW